MVPTQIEKACALLGQQKILFDGWRRAHTTHTQDRNQWIILIGTDHTSSHPLSTMPEPVEAPHPSGFPFPTPSPVVVAPPAAAAPPLAAAAPSSSHTLVCQPTHPSSLPPPTIEAINNAVAQETRIAEEVDIAESINLSGLHSDIQIEAARTPSSNKKKKPASKKPPPPPNANTLSVIEYYNHNQTQAS